MVITLVLVASRLVAILVAVSITVTSYRAYHRTSQKTFLYSMCGFACLSLGLGIESFLLRSVPLTLTKIHTIESLVFAVGFVILFFSLRGTS